MYKNFIIILSILVFINCKKKESFTSDYNNLNKIEELVLAIDKSNLELIENLISDNRSLLNVSIDSLGTGLLDYCIINEKYDSFEKILELGANPNYINPKNKYSVLITSITPFGNDREWRQDERYAKLLLKYKADPNYSTNTTEDSDGYSYIGYSPLTKASSLNLEIVKELVKYGADINKRVDGITPFGIAINSGKYDIALYYIDSLKVNLKVPLVIREKDSLFIQDLIVNNFTLTKLKGNITKLDSLKKIYPNIESDNQLRWRFIEKLQKRGINFKNYEYR